jgi:transposase
LLTREQDYAYAQPSLTKKKLRRLQITAGAPRYSANAAGVWSANAAVRQAERELAHQAEVAYARTVRDWHATQAKVGASATPGRASKKPSKGEAARQTTSP